MSKARLAPGAALALGLTLALSTSRVGAEATVSDCLKIERVEREAGVDFVLANGCDRSIACSMSWTLQCEAQPRPAPATVRRPTLLLPRGGRETVRGSADACRAHDGWSIDDVRYACAPVR